MLMNWNMLLLCQIHLKIEGSYSCNTNIKVEFTAWQILNKQWITTPEYNYSFIHVSAVHNIWKFQVLQVTQISKKPETTTNYIELTVSMFFRILEYKSPIAMIPNRATCDRRFLICKTKRNPWCKNAYKQEIN